MFRLTLFGPFSLTDSNGAEVSIASKKAKALLAYLAQSPGKPRSREEVLALLWSNREEAQGRASLRQVLTGLRKEVGQDLLRIDRDSVALNADQVDLAPPNGDEFLAGFSVNDPAFEEWLRDGRLRHEKETPAALPPVQTDPERHTIAVLPFDNLSLDPEQAFFSDGITQDIVTELSCVADLLVIAPFAAFHNETPSLTAQDIGTKLNAEYILQGSVRQASNRVRITARLTDAKSGAQVWATRYDRDLTDVFEIQEEVARHVATTVSGNIETRTFEVANKTPQADLSAYQLVLRAEWLSWVYFGDPRVREYLERAIELDPTFARAYSNLAGWHSYQSFSPMVDLQAITATVNHYSKRAVDIAPDDPFVLTNLATAHCNAGDHMLARHYIGKSIRLNPNHRLTVGIAAFVYAWIGETEASVAWLERYLDSAPLSLGITDNELIFEVLYLAERYDEAIATMSGQAEISTDEAVEYAAACAQAGHLDKAAELRHKFEVEKPEGHTFEAHAEAILRMCACERERDLWIDGYRKAGFPI